MGSYVGIDGLADIISDIVRNNHIESIDKFTVGLGAGFIMYGITGLEYAKNKYKS